jgi:predicted methyltransferase
MSHPAKGRLALACAAAILISSFALAGEAKAPPAVPAYVSAALADKARPEADVKLDEARKPGELIAFAGLKPGMKVIDFIPGGGYFTRVFAKVVGPKGRVYAFVPTEQIKANPKALERTQAVVDDKAYGNVFLLKQPVNVFGAPEQVDVVWTTLNYHDLYVDFLGPANVPQFNKMVFNSLKPGGVYLVVDHAAAAGSGHRDVNTLHRIDPAAVKAEVEAAGFVLESQSPLLANPEDDHSKRVFDPSIRRHTDQFVYKFRKPRR